MMICSNIYIYICFFSKIKNQKRGGAEQTDMAKKNNGGTTKRRTARASKGVGKIDRRQCFTPSPKTKRLILKMINKKK